ncbi:hypothetical protein [Escherichia phage ECP2303]
MVDSSYSYCYSYPRKVNNTTPINREDKKS